MIPTPPAADRRRAAAATFLLLPLLAVLPGCRGRSAGAAAPGAERRNVVVVLSDALRAASLPIYGYPRDTAPFLTELARESVVFDQHLANYPGTPISVSQMQTGRLMPPLLMDFSYAVAPIKAIGDDLLILPRAFAAAGYRTGIVTAHPWFDARARLLQFFASREVVKPLDDFPYARFEDVMPAIDRFLAAGRGDPRPFFLYVHVMDTHGPFRYHPGFEQYRDAPGWPTVYGAYDSEILYTDHWTRVLYDKLKAAGRLDDTVFVFTADHGEELGELGRGVWNRSHGYTVRRVQLHVPLIVRLPRDPAPGRHYAELSRHIDLAPTLLRLAMPGVDLSPYHVDGEDLSVPVAGGPRPAGDPPPEERESVSYSWRYWGLHRAAGVELHYDQWEDGYTLYRATPRQFNFPVPEALDDPALEKEMEDRLASAYRRFTRELMALPPSWDELGRSIVGVPTSVVHGESSIPTYENLPDDGRWFRDVVLQVLEAEPGESPGPITVAMPWAHGRYHVTLHLDLTALRKRWANRFRLQFLGGANRPFEVDGRQADAYGEVDLGTQQIGDLMTLRVSDPEGGVAIAGIELAIEGKKAEAAPLDPELEKRLRALGYVR